MPTILAERIGRDDLYTVAGRFSDYYKRHDLTSPVLDAYYNEDPYNAGPSARTMVHLVNDRPGYPWAVNSAEYRRHDRNLTAILRRATGSKQATGLHYDAAHPYLPQLCWYRED
jgi:hypothetical protein